MARKKKVLVIINNNVIIKNNLYFSIKINQKVNLESFPDES